MGKMRNFIFDHLDTFEGDNLKNLYETAYAFQHRKSYRILIKIIGAYWGVLSIFLGAHIMGNKNKSEDHLIYIHCWSTSVGCFTIYACSVGLNEIHKTVIRVQENIYLKYWKSSPKRLNKKMQIFSRKMEKSCKCFSGVLIISSLYFFFNNLDAIISTPFLNFQSVVMLTPISILCSIHASLFIPRVIMLMSYFSLHLLYDLDLLNWKINKFMKNDDKWIKKRADFAQYQCKVNEELVNLIQYYIDIFRFYQFNSEVLKFRLIIATVLGCIVCGCLLITTMPLPLSKSLPYQGLIFSYIAFQMILIELGQTIQTQSEKLYNNILKFNWYRWSRVNRKNLLMFMKICQKPMIFRFYGLFNMNRDLNLKIFKGIYSVINFYKATTI